MSDDPIQRAIASLPDEPLGPERQRHVLRLAQAALEAEKSVFARADHFMMDKLMPMAFAAFIVGYSVGLVDFLKRTYMSDGKDAQAQILDAPSARPIVLASADE